MAGNVGIYGGDPAGFGLCPVGLQPNTSTGLIARKMPGGLPEGARQRPAIHITKLWDAILRGKEGGYKVCGTLLKDIRGGIIDSLAVVNDMTAIGVIQCLLDNALEGDSAQYHQRCRDR